jgi:signal transduction histidine kinase/HAMP domain-containing protein
MRRPRGLSTRLLVAICALAVLHIAVFVVLLTALRQEQRADRQASGAGAVLIAAATAREAIDRLQVAERGLAIAGGRPELVREWERSAAAVRASAADLDRQLRREGPASARALGRSARAYLARVSAPLAALARRDPELARRRIVGGSERPGIVLSRQLGALRLRERDARQTRRAEAAQLVRVAWIAAAVGIFATLLCAVAFLAYVRHALLLPLRRVADAARALAAGHLSARVAEPGERSNEVSELARTFDTMAASLQDSRAALERQNEELAAQSVELVEAVRSAREGTRVLRAVLDATPDAIALLHADGTVLVDNPPMRAVRDAFGAHATAIDQHGALVPLHDGKTDVERRDEIVLVGTRRTFARYVAPVHDERGRLIGRLLALRDVTGEREAERAKDEFFALVSHELRTPLTAILGYLELLLGEDGDGNGIAGERGRHLQVIDRNARRLMRLVGDLLFAAQVETGTLLLDPGEVDLSQLVRDAVVLARPQAKQGRIALETQIEPLGLCVGDRDRLAQVLDNLVSNALKFTPRGGRVTIGLQAIDGRARVTVADTGIGVPADELPRLFDRFYRASNATARAVPGAGLGLTIVRAIVEGHGGTVKVRSVPDHGTTFTVLLPLRRAEQPPARTPAATGYAAGGR